MGTNLGIPLKETTRMVSGVHSLIPSFLAYRASKLLYLLPSWTCNCMELVNDQWTNVPNGYPLQNTLRGERSVVFRLSGPWWSSWCAAATPTVTPWDLETSRVERRTVRAEARCPKYGHGSTAPTPVNIQSPLK